jgi:hypothetical protein
MTIYYLYVKTHRITGLKYLGQTKQDPYKYPGSGKDWIAHIAKFGNHVDTSVILKTENKAERDYWGRYYSSVWNIVHGQDDFGNKIWANRIPETGGGQGQGRDFWIAYCNSEKNPFRKRADGTSVASDRYANGTHPFLDGTLQRKTQQRLVATGKHNFQDSAKARQNNLTRLANGTHPSQVKWCCLRCKLQSSGIGQFTQHLNSCAKKSI